MDNPISTRCRSHFWLVVFTLFVFWYILLYVYDWSSVPGLTRNVDTKSHANSSALPNSNFVHVPSNPNSVTSTKQDSNASRNVTDVIMEEEEKPTKNISSQKDWIEPVDQIQALEKESEPLLRRNGAENGNEPKESCAGRYIYVHDLPTQFNDDLVKQCKSLSRWSDMCQYMINMGLGPDLGNPQRVFLPTGWFSTNQFSLELIFHNRMKQYECLTNDSSKASAVFVPYYAGLDIARYLWGGFNMSTRDKTSLDMARWLREKPEWKAMRGRDHFLVAGRITWDFRRVIDEESVWGNKLMVLPEFKNVTMLTIESSPWNSNDFAIPYPTYFHPSNDNEVIQWQNKVRRQRRRILFSFAGAPRPNIEDSIRGEIMDQCISAQRRCKLLECKNDKNKCEKPLYVMKVFQSSIFCLQPSGDSFTRRSTFDSILAGCIPVFFSPGSAYVQYLWHLPRDFNKYSVLIPEDDVKEKKVNIEKVLNQIPKSKVLAMREEVIRLIPKVIYADPRSKLEKLEDAFDITVKGVLERMEMLRRGIREGKNSSFDIDEEYSWKYNLFGTVDKHDWDHFFLRTDRGRY
ncbi:hypothetical protein RJ640_003728 [Escallonia rubra]|uniref:Exostosin GT47 domain-containing protein n=1 Tax=Escallonia rubra TaxID=112253 RepID=A0AA88SB09_9ASTE|nr:hypothetical protein RJ640_003728 [Escallonia rubra]